MTIHPYIASAKKVLEREKEGIAALETWLGEPFIHAIEIICKRKGRVIVGGMGKSGHIAKKIAATLASTGTPSLYVHPGEASHGDLGMITKEDTVILLSNSGETIELRDIINYCKRFAIPIIAIVRKGTSILVTAADAALVLPEIPEVCDVKAPTTSTTMMLALGDAIAIALLEKHGFSPDDFSVLHPGGRLGVSFIKVKDIMHRGQQIPLVKENTGVKEAIQEMSGKGFGCTGVINDQGELTGIITDGDLRRHISGNLTGKKAHEVMTKNPVTINDGSLASEALNVMQGKSITALLILKDKKPKGILHIHDLLKAGVA